MTTLRLLSAVVVFVGISGFVLTPLIVIQALLGEWESLRVYTRIACWGGVYLAAASLLIGIAR